MLRNANYTKRGGIMDKITEIAKINETLKKRKKVAIVGFAPHWWKTPWEDMDFEIWTLNEAYKLMNAPIAQEKKIKFRANRWFEIHNRNSPSKNTPEHINFLKTCKLPVYMQEHYEDIPTSIEFPFYEIVQWLEEKGHIGHRYFTNSISWMIALAIYEGFEEIHIYGVDMAQDVDKNGNDEYGYQKPSCEYMIGVAEKYAKVILPEDSDLLYNTKLYGVEMDNQEYVFCKKQIRVIGEREKQTMTQIQQLQAQVSKLNAGLNQMAGAKEAYRHLLKKRVL
jgi:hypothetical protein